MIESCRASCQTAVVSSTRQSDKLFRQGVTLYTTRSGSGLEGSLRLTNSIPGRYDLKFEITMISYRFYGPFASPPALMMAVIALHAPLSHSNLQGLEFESVIFTKDGK